MEYKGRYFEDYFG